MIVTLGEVSQRFLGRWALTRLTLGVPEGVAVLLTGENGAGKTTLLRIMSTALKPTRGALTLFGRSAWPDPAEVRPRIGLMTHHHFLYEALSARENLALVRRLSGRGTEGLQEALLERVGLSGFADVAVSTYSAGMKRRLVLARLLLGDPELVLLDEPFGQLDPAGVALMADVIGELRRRGATQVISTHDIERGEALCSHHIHLASGRAELRQVSP
jgi:heme exporter protein A